MTRALVLPPPVVDNEEHPLARTVLDQYARRHAPVKRGRGHCATVKFKADSKDNTPVGTSTGNLDRDEVVQNEGIMPSVNSAAARMAALRARIRAKEAAAKQRYVSSCSVGAADTLIGNGRRRITGKRTVI